PPRHPGQKRAIGRADRRHVAEQEMIDAQQEERPVRDPSGRNGREEQQRDVPADSKTVRKEALQLFLRLPFPEIRFLDWHAASRLRRSAPVARSRTGARSSPCPRSPRLRRPKGPRPTA